MEIWPPEETVHHLDGVFDERARKPIRFLAIPDPLPEPERRALIRAALKEAETVVIFEAVRE